MHVFFYKEWIKIRYFFLIALVLSVLFCVYAMLNINRVIELKGAAHIWEVMLQRDAIFIHYLRFVPLLMGAVAGMMQFVPEMQQKRIKLTLHLPCSSLHSIGAMLLFGAGLLILISLVNLLLLDIFLLQHFAVELVRRIILTGIVWYVAGLAAYFFTAWICLEPTWKMRVFALLVAVAVLRIFFISETPEAYNAFLPLLVVYTLLAASLPFWSVKRLKDGKQD